MANVEDAELTVAENVRFQLFYAMKDSVSQDIIGPNQFRDCRDTLVRRYGLERLCQVPNRVEGGLHPHEREIKDWLLSCSVRQVLDAVEALYSVLLRRGEGQASALADRVNAVMGGASLGWRLSTEFDAFIRIDNGLTESELVPPAARILRAHGFEAAEGELGKALAAYRSGEHDKAILEANKAFESTMKCALTRVGQVLPQPETAKRLLEACRKATIIPELVSGFGAKLEELLCSGLPKMRNKLPVAHGAGHTADEADQAYAQLAVHLSASYIIFICERVTSHGPHAEHANQAMGAGRDGAAAGGGDG